MNKTTFDVVIIGAGMAGLTAARQLVAAGLSVGLVDKGHHPGGRLATHRLGAGRGDSGAQFFTVRDTKFAAAVAEWQRDGLVFEWSRGWSDGSISDSTTDGYPRYAISGGFSQLPKTLAGGLNLHLSERVVSLAETERGWRVTAESGLTLTGHTLIMTPPVPHSLALLDEGDVVLPAEDRAALQAIAYAPCLCGLFVVEGATGLPEPGALQRPDAAISWIADNQRKGISSGARVITVHAGPESSASRWDAADADLLRWLADNLRPFVCAGTAVKEGQLKKWRYALPLRLHPEPVLIAATRQPLVLAGDAFGTARVEGAFLSGLAAAAGAIRTSHASQR